MGTDRNQDSCKYIISVYHVIKYKCIYRWTEVNITNVRVEEIVNTIPFDGWDQKLRVHLTIMRYFHHS